MQELELAWQQGADTKALEEQIQRDQIEKENLEKEKVKRLLAEGIRQK